MKFQAQLNAYIQQLDCLAKELSAASGISAATLSRYRSGERLPDPNAPAFGQLRQGIARLAAERGLTEVTEEAVRAAFFAAEDFAQADTEQLMRNFDLLLSMLDISVSKLCRHINYDPSTIFRFRNGSRRPAEPERFAAAVASSIVRERDTPQDMAVLAVSSSVRQTRWQMCRCASTDCATGCSMGRSQRWAKRTSPAF